MTVGTILLVVFIATDWNKLSISNNNYSKLSLIKLSMVESFIDVSSEKTCSSKFSCLGMKSQDSLAYD